MSEHYFQAIDFAFLGIRSVEQPLALLSSLDNLLLTKGAGLPEHQFNPVDGPLELECRQTVAEWLKDHPFSRAAKGILNSGLVAPAHQHLSLYLEIKSQIDI